MIKLHGSVKTERWTALLHSVMTALMQYSPTPDDINGWLSKTGLPASLQEAVMTVLMHSLSGTNDMIRILKNIKYLVHITEAADGQALPDTEVADAR